MVNPVHFSTSPSISPLLNLLIACFKMQEERSVYIYFVIMTHRHVSSCQYIDPILLTWTLFECSHLSWLKNVPSLPPTHTHTFTYGVAWVWGPSLTHNGSAARPGWLLEGCTRSCALISLVWGGGDITLSCHVLFIYRFSLYVLCICKRKHLHLTAVS